jgi:hypothetical protein
LFVDLCHLGHEVANLVAIEFSHWGNAVDVLDEVLHALAEQVTVQRER